AAPQPRPRGRASLSRPSERGRFLDGHRRAEVARRRRLGGGIRGNRYRPRGAAVGLPGQGVVRAGVVIGGQLVPGESTVCQEAMMPTLTRIMLACAALVAAGCASMFPELQAARE